MGETNINQINLIQPFGYSEMYEWAKIPDKKLGLFVQFSKRYPNMIEPFHSKDRILLGVSTICSMIDSDDPDEWKYAYMCNNVGDTYLRKEKLAVGIKMYDQENEISYISTRPYEHLVKIPNKEYRQDEEYIKRSNRQEWVRVNLLGKTIVIDNGKCIPGEYCQPYIGNDMRLAGTAVPYDGTSHGFYVLQRVTDDTIMIINNSVCNL